MARRFLPAQLCVAALLLLALRSTRPAFTGSRLGAQRAPSVAARARNAYIALVDVNVVEGGEQEFLEASLRNARCSVKEGDNKRFDVLQAQDELQHFALVEMYGSAEGPTDHKATSHYRAWRDEVAPLMASPRSASQWDCVFPTTADAFAPGALILERDNPQFFDINHVYADVEPGKESDFIEKSMRYCQMSLAVEEATMRLDVLRNVDDPSRFLLQEVFYKPEAGVKHRRGDSFARWRDEVAGMMVRPRTTQKWINHFPNLPVGWNPGGILP